mgnify:CR=1 FL=1
MSKHDLLYIIPLLHIRYCQVVIKALKNAGRAPEIEFCKQSAVALEERLRLHSQV